MSQTYQITTVTRDDDGVHVTVVYSDDVAKITAKRIYAFAGEPDPTELDTMLKAEGPRQLKAATVHHQLASGQAVLIPPPV